MKPINERLAKRQFEQMLRPFTAGSILYLFAELHRQAAVASQADDAMSCHQCKTVEHESVVVDTGSDVARPRRRIPGI